MSEEIPLLGGSLTSVVRVGQTVRREARECSEVVLELLRHLEVQGFEGAPRALGLDEQGREMLTFIEGDVGVGLPPYVWHDEVLGHVGRLMRRYHDLASTFRPTEARWQIPPLEPMETICHNDITPWNTVFRSGVPFAFIDWDYAAPGLASGISQTPRGRGFPCGTMGSVRPQACLPVSLLRRAVFGSSLRGMEWSLANPS